MLGLNFLYTQPIRSIVLCERARAAAAGGGGGGSAAVHGRPWAGRLFEGNERNKIKILLRSRMVCAIMIAVDDCWCCSYIFLLINVQLNIEFNTFLKCLICPLFAYFNSTTYFIFLVSINFILYQYVYQELNR